MSYSQHWKDSGLYREYSGIVTGQDIFESAQEARKDARFDKICYIFNDFSKADTHAISQADIALIAAVGKVSARTNPDVLVANVLNNEAALALAEIYRHKIQGGFRECRNFSDLDAAWEWIRHDLKINEVKPD